MLGAKSAIRTGQHATRRNKAAARSRSASGGDLRMGGAKAFGDASETRRTFRIDGQYAGDDHGQPWRDRRQQARIGLANSLEVVPVPVIDTDMHKHCAGA